MQAAFPYPIIETRHVLEMLTGVMSHPGRIAAVEGTLRAPRPLHTASAIVCHCCLHDTDSLLWTDLERDPLTVQWLLSVCGGRLAPGPESAQVALISSPARIPPLERFHHGARPVAGSPLLMIVQTPALTPGTAAGVRGPGEPRARRPAVKGLSGDFWQRRRACRVPLDLLFTSNNLIAGVPAGFR